MQEERMLILKMLAEGKITAEEAEQLMKALEGDPAAAPGEPGPARPPSPGPRIAVDLEDLSRHVRWRVQDALGRLIPAAGDDPVIFEEVLEGRFDPGVRPRLRFLVADGGIKVTAATGSEYRVVIRKQILAAGPEEAESLAAAAARVARSGNSLSIDAGRSGRHRGRPVVTIEARLPRDHVYAAVFLAANGKVEVQDLDFAALRVATANGGVRLDGVEAEGINCRTANGSIHVAAGARRLRAMAVNGSLEIHPRPRGDGGEVNLRTISGPIRLSLPGETGCDVEAATVAGRIRLEGGGLETVTDERGLVGRRLRVRSGGEGPRLTIRASTTSGSIGLITRGGLTDDL